MHDMDNNTIRHYDIINYNILYNISQIRLF